MQALLNFNSKHREVGFIIGESLKFPLKDDILSRFCSRVLPTHEPFGAMPSARTPFHAGVERAESAQGDFVTVGAWQGLTHYVSGPVCVRMCALCPVGASCAPSLRYTCASPCVSPFQLSHPPLRGVLPVTIG